MKQLDKNDFNGIRLSKHLNVVQPDRLKELAYLERPLRVKVGFDPTAADLHLGHTVVLQAAREFQDQGHLVCLVIGNFTALIGDPSGRDCSRPELSQAQVEQNSRAFIEQAFKVLDPDMTRVRSNADWFAPMPIKELLRLMSRVTVNQMQVRADFGKRLANDWPVSMHEFVYPLLQAYDSVLLNSDIELGGNDQLFNLLMGCDMQGDEGMPKQVAITVPLLHGFDVKVDPDGTLVGHKMSKSIGNHIAIGAGQTPLEMFNKVLLIRDQAIDHFVDLLAPELWTPKTAKSPRRELTLALAKALVTRFHGAEALTQVLKDREAAAAGDAPEGVETKSVKVAGSAALHFILMRTCGVVNSKTNALRLIKGGAVRINGTKVTTDVDLISNVTYEIRVGSKNRKYFRVEVQDW